jgi:diguanylate cyclase (GGDEF)-like protein
MTAPLLEKIRSADNLPSPPMVAIQVLELMQHGEVSAADLAAVIQQDPAMTGRMLKVANSSLFGQSGRIGSLQQAMVVLGMRTVKVMVLSFSLVDTVSDIEFEAFDYAGFWRRSLTTAVAARLIASDVHKPLADTAFVAGLLADIGILAAIQCAPEDYTPVVDLHALGELPLYTIEQDMFGVTHAAISGTLLAHWSLPKGLIHSVTTHHASNETADKAIETPQQLNRIVRSAAWVAEVFCEPSQTAQLDAVKDGIKNELQLDDTSLDQILTELNQHVRQTASVFCLDIGQTRSYQQIQAEAVAQLARLSMTSELERAEIERREAAAQQQVKDLNHQNADLQRKASTDSLTGVANRAAFDQQLAQACQAAAEENDPIGLIMLDIDRFKKLNDTFGHQIGDEALRQVGNCLKAVENDTTFVSRYGGEEFALIVAQSTEQSIRQLAEEIREAIQQLRIDHGERKLTLTASFGGTHVEPACQPVDLNTLIRTADQCLYHAKQSGRNRVVVREINAEN